MKEPKFQNNIVTTLDNNEEKKLQKEVITLDIEGKKYEVTKSHFDYPKDIVKENGGVEGYDRFKLLWHDLGYDPESGEGIGRFSKLLSNISEKLEIGTEMQDETISHYVGGVYFAGMKWNMDRVFLTKPFDISDYFRIYQEKGSSPYIGPTLWFIGKDNKPANMEEYLKKSAPEYAKQMYGGFGAISSEYRLKDLDISNFTNYLKDKEIITSPMSFCQGSNLTPYRAAGFGSHDTYQTPFFNFNSRNQSFANYIENLKNFGNKKFEKSDFLRIQMKSTERSHPRFPLVFSKDFPPLRWCFADTGYVPMKEGPNFFRFYSKNTELGLKS